MKFTALIPTRDRPDYLAKTLETLRRQDYDDWEAVVSDNCSGADVAAVVAAFDDPRIRYSRTDRLVPVTENWNNAMSRATGDYVIMLGDDDGLMPSYFRRAAELIGQFDRPDLLYTGALLFGYPGAVKEFPEGFLHRYSYAEFFSGRREPSLLDPSEARRMVRDMLNFRASYGFNMQFALFSRGLAGAMADKGPLFQSPFPDYYAMNAMFLRAARILVVPESLAIIGICPKSYGSHLNKNDEAAGIEFLEAAPTPPGYERLANVVLPGTNINTSWLYAAETLVDHYGQEFGLKVGYGRYRMVQAIDGYRRHDAGAFPEAEVAKLDRQLRPWERLAYRGTLRTLLGGVRLASGLTPLRALARRVLSREVDHARLVAALWRRLDGAVLRQFVQYRDTALARRRYADVVDVAANLEPGFSAAGS